MSYSPILLVHICGGTLGLLSGTAAMSFRKGSLRHVLAGKVFVVSMLTLAAAAVYLAILKDQTPKVVGGLLTFSSITTTWLTARPREREKCRFYWLTRVIPVAI